MNENTKKILWCVIGFIAVIFLFRDCSCSCGSDSDSDSYSSNGYAGAHVADQTILQSGKVTTFIINSDGTAIVIDASGYRENTYWDEFETNVIVVHDEYSQYDDYMDFRSKMVYQGGYSGYRSKEYGHPFRRK